MKRRTLNDYEYNLKFKYHDFLINNKKTPNELCSYIKNRFDVIDVSKKENQLLNEKKQFRLNYISSWYNADTLLEQEDVMLNSYLVIRNSKSEVYYQEFEQKYFSKPIYIIIEMKTGYISSNCDSLNNELYLCRGISETDIRTNSPDLLLYLRLLDERKVDKQY